MNGYAGNDDSSSLDRLRDCKAKATNDKSAHFSNQLVNVSTHIQGNILDLVVTNSPHLVSNLTVTNNILPFLKTDHFLISFEVIQSIKPAHSMFSSTVPDFSKADLEGLSSYLFDFDFSPSLSSSDVAFVWAFIRDAIYSGLDLFVPRTRLRTKSFPKWFSPDIIHDCKRLHTLKRSSRQLSAYKLSKLESLRQSLQERIAHAKSDYESALIVNCSKSNLSKIYGHIRSVTCSSDILLSVHLDSVFASSNIDIATLFNKYFYSVFTPDTSNLQPFCNFSSIANSLHSISISESDVFDALSSLDPSKAKGIDDISPSVLKSCALGLYIPLHHLFNLCLFKGTIPTQ